MTNDIFVEFPVHAIVIVYFFVFFFHILYDLLIIFPITVREQVRQINSTLHCTPHNSFTGVINKWNSKKIFSDPSYVTLYD